MNLTTPPLDGVARQAKDAAQEASAWVERLARFGYAAKGVAYLAVGFLAAQAAFGAGGEVTDKEGALTSILGEPYGQLLLAIVALGLVGYVIWRFVQAIVDTENHGADLEGLAQRGVAAGRGILYAGLVLEIVRVLLGAGGGGGEQQTQSIIARVLAWPYGQWLVIAAGLAIVAAGIVQLWIAYEAEFRERFKLHEMNPTGETWATRAGRLGFTARAVVYATIGVLIVQAALNFNPEQSGGYAQALRTLQQQPYGPWLLGLVAIGLVAYGVYSFVEARYRQIYID